MVRFGIGDNFGEFLSKQYMDRLVVQLQSN